MEGMMARKPMTEIDFDDEDAVLAEVAKALDIDPDELRTDNGLVYWRVN
jgi:hypothetical protein